MTADSRERWLGRAWIVGRVVFWIVAFVYAVELSRRSIQLGDEGCLMSQVLAMLEGRVPYRDFDMFVAPGIWYLLEAVFSITGPGLLASRWVAAFCLLATMFVSRRVVSEVAGPRWADLAPLLIAIFSMWAFPFWSFAFYSPWATLFALCALAAVLAWIRSRRTIWLLACGVACGLTVVFKQNYGLFACVGSGLAIMIDLAARRDETATWKEVASQTARAGIPVVAGVLVPLVPLLALLAQAGALEAAFDSLVVRPFGGFARSHSIPYVAFGDFGSFRQINVAGGYIYRSVAMAYTDIQVRWPASAVWMIDLFHWGLYWIPPALFAGVLGRGWMRRSRATSSDRALVAVAVFALVYFLGVFPRADLNHLINVLQPVLCLAAAAAAVCFESVFRRRQLLRTGAAAASAAIFVGYALIAAAWMNDVRKLFAHPVTAERGGVLVTELEAESINHEVETLRRLTANNEPVFALAALSMIPFLAERPMPSRYYNYYSVHVGFDRGASAAEEIEASGARVILADYENFFADWEGMLSFAPVLTDYLARTFVPVRSVGGQRHLILERRPVPLQPRPEVSLEWLCSSINGGPPHVFSREHMLFRSMYHSFAGIREDESLALTVCRTRIPSKATLHLQLQLRQFDPAAENSRLTASAWIWPDEGTLAELFSTTWPLATEIGQEGPPAREVDVELDRWAGQNATLFLRTRYEGGADPPETGLGSLSLLWNRGTLESEDYLYGPKLPDQRIEAMEPGS